MKQIGSSRLAITISILSLSLCVLSPHFLYPEASSSPARAAKNQPTAASGVVPASAATHGSVIVNGRVIQYSATAEEYIFRDETGHPVATMFSVAYASNQGNFANRPVTFLFNGGPGAATIGLRESLAPLHTVAAANADGFAFVDNADSLIDASDLVFLDPVGTGYSRLLDPAAQSQFWGTEADARATATFIADWLQRNHRTLSPTFIAGESYGGIRAALAAQMLAKRSAGPIDLHGVMLISPSTYVRRPNVESREIDALPTMAAIARDYGKGSYVGLNINDVLEDSRRFAKGPYAAAIRAGTALPAAQSKKIANQLADFTGLSTALVQSVHLRLTPNYFARHLLAEQGECVSTEDGRVHALRSVVDKQPPPYNDPDSTKITLSYNPDTAMDRLFRSELGYKPASPYVRLSMKANQGWNSAVPSSDGDVPEIFKKLMTVDPHLRLLVLMGYYDLTVPFTTTTDDFNRARLPSDRFSTVLLPAGHQVLVGDASRTVAIGDLRSFIQANSPAR